MSTQTQINQLQMDFNAAASANMRDQGIKKAVLHAESVFESWQDKAYDFLLSYIRQNSEFMTEQVRKASKGVVPEPPSARAWGGVVVRAAKTGLISRNGYRAVSNVKAHRTPATVWKVVNQ